MLAGQSRGKLCFNNRFLLWQETWIPAFAGMTREGDYGNAGSHFHQRDVIPDHDLYAVPFVTKVRNLSDRSNLHVLLGT